jgi:hypothetical protein
LLLILPFRFKQRSNAQAPQSIQKGDYRRIIRSSTEVRGDRFRQPVDMLRERLSEIPVITSFYNGA